MNEGQRKALADRKRQLIVQGAVLRAEIVHARGAAHASLRPDALARGVLGHLMPIARAAVGSLGGASGILAAVNGRSVLPLVLSGVSAVARKLRRPSTPSLSAPPSSALRRPAWRIAIALGAVAALTALAIKAKQARRTETEAEGAAPANLPKM